jgi:CDP-diacylglycerol--glycerol-3-phosphate 3-phosphatidyltransferase
MISRRLQIRTGPGERQSPRDPVRLNWPMGLTMLRLLLLPLFLWIVLVDAGRPNQPGSGDRELRWLAVGIFAVMALTDKLDGYLARRFNQTTKLGAVLDPVADKLLIACSLIVLSFPWVATARYEVPLPVILAVYGKDLAVAIGAMTLIAVAGKVEISPRILGKASTVLQLALVLSTLVAADMESISPRLATVVVRGLWGLVVLAAAAAGADYALEGSRQYNLYRLREAVDQEQALTDSAV